MAGPVGPLGQFVPLPAAEAPSGADLARGFEPASATVNRGATGPRALARKCAGSSNTWAAPEPDRAAGAV